MCAVCVLFVHQSQIPNNISIPLHSQNVNEERKRSFFGGSEAATNGSHLFRNLSTADTKIDMKEETTYTASQEDLKRLQKETILKKIPDNAEATTVLVSFNLVAPKFKKKN